MLKNSSLTIYYVILTIVSAVIYAVPFIGFIIPFGFILPTIWLYVTILLPAFILRKFGFPRFLALSIGLIAVASLAFLPNYYANPIAKKLTDDLIKNDFSNELPQSPRAIEFIINSNEHYVEGASPLVDAICDEICQTLLISKQVDSITIRALRTEGHPPVTITYVFKEQGRCPTAIHDTFRILPTTIKAFAEGRCIIPQFGVEMAEGLIIEDKTLENTYGIPTTSLASIEKAKRINIISRKNFVDTPLLRQTEVRMRVTSSPFMATHYGGIFTTVHIWAPSKNLIITNQYTLMDFLSGKLGFPKTFLEEQPCPTLASAEACETTRLKRPSLVFDNKSIDAILNQPGSEPFGAEVESAVMNWSVKYWQPALTKKIEAPDNEAIALISRILLDKRTYPAHALTNILASHRELTPQFADQILTRLSWPEPKARNRTYTSFSYSIARQLSDDQIRKNAPKIIQVLEMGPTANTAPLYSAAARLGKDGLPLLLKGMQSKDSEIFVPAVIGACRADRSIAPSLTPVINALFSDSNIGNYPIILIVALAGLEGRQAAEDAISRMPESDRARMTQALNHHYNAKGELDCVY